MCHSTIRLMPSRGRQSVEEKHPSTAPPLILTFTFAGKSLRVGRKTLVSGILHVTQPAHNMNLTNV